MGDVKSTSTFILASEVRTSAVLRDVDDEAYLEELRDTGGRDHVALRWTMYFQDAWGICEVHHDFATASRTGAITRR